MYPTYENKGNANNFLAVSVFEAKIPKLNPAAYLPFTEGITSAVHFNRTQMFRLLHEHMQLTTFCRAIGARRHRFDATKFTQI